MKICVYAIALNEVAHARRFLAAAADADLIVIADTGSTDGTPDALTIHNGLPFGKVVVHHISVKPWRFDDARNACLALLPSDIDVCVSLDLDEELQPGWREEIERVWTEETTRLYYMFDWGAGIAFAYDKIHQRHGYRWTRACHERLWPDRITEVWAKTDKLLVIHRPDPTKSRGQYLDLLRLSTEEDPYDNFNAFYYGRELGFAGRWEESIRECERYLALPRATWINERCYAMRCIGKAYEELGDVENALSWYRRASAEAPQTREPWCALAILCYRTSRWGECYGAAREALKLVHKELVYTIDPELWGPLPHDMAAISAWNLGMFDIAAQHARDAIALDPADERLQNNLRLIEASMKPKRKRKVA